MARSTRPNHKNFAPKSKSASNKRKPGHPRRLVFISHSGTDTWVARQIARAVGLCGAKAFLDEAEIAKGADFESEIKSNLNDAHEMLVLMTPWAMERPYVLAELGVAWHRNIPIVVLLHGITAEKFMSKDKFPVFVKKRNLSDLNGIDTYLRELKARSNGKKP